MTECKWSFSSTDWIMIEEYVLTQYEDIFEEGQVVNYYESLVIELELVSKFSDIVIFLNHLQILDGYKGGEPLIYDYSTPFSRAALTKILVLLYFHPISCYFFPPYPLLERQMEEFKKLAMSIETEIITHLNKYWLFYQIDTPEWFSDIEHNHQMLTVQNSKILETTIQISETRSLKTTERSQEILTIITELGYDPLSIPKTAPGRSGLKNQVSNLALENKKLFTLSGFKKAWQELRSTGKIKERE